MINTKIYSAMPIVQRCNFRLHSRPNTKAFAPKQNYSNLPFLSASVLLPQLGITPKKNPIYDIPVSKSPIKPEERREYTTDDFFQSRDDILYTLQEYELPYEAAERLKSQGEAFFKDYQENPEMFDEHEDVGKEGKAVLRIKRKEDNGFEIEVEKHQDGSFKLSKAILNSKEIDSKTNKPVEKIEYNFLTLYGWPLKRTICQNGEQILVYQSFDEDDKSCYSIHIIKRIDGKDLNIDRCKNRISVDHEDGGSAGFKITLPLYD